MPDAMSPSLMAGLGRRLLKSNVWPIRLKSAGDGVARECERSKSTPTRSVISPSMNSIGRESSASPRQAR